MSAADDRAAFEAWWDGDVPSTFEPYDIGFKGQAWAAWQAAIAAEREAAAKVCPASPDYEKHVQRMIDEGRGTFTDIVRLAEGAFGDGVSRTLAAIRARGAS